MLKKVNNEFGSSSTKKDEEGDKHEDVEYNSQNSELENSDECEETDQDETENQDEEKKQMKDIFDPRN